MNPLTQSKNTTILPVLIALTLACFALAPQARAVCQDGCDGSFNTFLGDDALINNVVAQNNTAVGYQTLYSNTAGPNNTAVGAEALYSNTTGAYNTATGGAALFLNTDGISNTAVGYQTLYSNTTGDSNTAIGAEALYSNTTGVANTATGWGALGGNTSGHNNIATGITALYNNTTGHENTAVGFAALVSNTTGVNNIALGTAAGQLLTTGDNNIDIGNFGVAAESNSIRIGTQGTQTTTFIAGIAGAAGNGRPVVINANGRLGTTPSSARFKEEIKPMDKASEAILVLKPVTFRYKQGLDPEGIPQFGLVAEDVEKVNPDLVARDDQGKPFTVRYEAVNAMLLNEFLKEHRRVEALQASFAQQQKDFQATVAQQQKQIEALTAGLQKVSAQLELSKSAPQTVLNNH